MHYLLYNPLSKNGSNQKTLDKVAKIFNKEGIETKTLDIIETSKDVLGFNETLTKDDALVIIGGDGTLHKFVNGIRNIDIPCKIYLYRGGTGNDFGREFKGKVIDITKIAYLLPTFTINGKEELFSNCSGFGIDGEVCNMVNESKEAKRGFNYFKSAIHLFKTFKPFDLEAVVDGNKYRFKRVWFATVMNGKYFGGGMKISPKSDRFDDKMELYVIHSLKLWKLLLVFPLIFIGKHMWFKGLGITKLCGKEFHLVASTPQVFQTDGEVTKEVKSFDAKIERELI